MQVSWLLLTYFFLFRPLEVALQWVRVTSMPAHQMSMGASKYMSEKGVAVNNRAARGIDEI